MYTEAAVKGRSTRLGFKTWELLWEGGRPRPGSEGHSEVGRGIEVTTVYSRHHVPPPAFRLLQTYMREM